MKILDLFSGTQSVKKAFPNADYIGIDIYGENNIILDLSQKDIIEKLIKVLPKNWKPDVIWASPICTPFSRATSIASGTLSYVVENSKLRLRNNKEYDLITHKAYYHLRNKPSFIKKHTQAGKLGLKLFNNTQKIIEHFNVPFVLENPANAVSRYLPHLKSLEANLTHYCVYDFGYKKATNIYSKQILDLKKCNHEKHELVLSGHPSKTKIKPGPSSNKERSVVPKELIKSIFNQLLEKEKGNKNE